jgi:TPP-dependent 2-oxoacid decarboxylase
MPNTATIGEYLLQQLSRAGVTHLFGVPGDYVLRFHDLLVHSGIRHIGTTREDTAAFAADGYARCHGIGALAVTYGVGALNVVNAVAGAYTESSPVVAISGAPGVKEQRGDPLIHHRFGPFGFQREIFERITCATVVLDDPLMAFRQIDRALALVQLHSKPVYIELPRDMIDVAGFSVPAEENKAPGSDADTLKEAVAETLDLIAKAKSPAVLAGVEMHRHGLQDVLVSFVEGANVPLAATLTGKSVVGERHSHYLGVYEGAMGSPTAKEVIEGADLLLMLGLKFNDVDMGIYTANLNPNSIVRASGDEVFIRHHRYPHVQLWDFLNGLARGVTSRVGHVPKISHGPTAEGFPRGDAAMTVARLIGRINDGLTPDMTLVCDVGDCLFAAVELRVHRRTQFLASAFYTSMGFAVPAALGAQLARPLQRSLVLVGDGAFQMTGTELSSIARLDLNAIVIVFNNSGYSTERYILEGPFNDIAGWRFDKLGEVFGPLNGYDVRTEAEFECAFTAALATMDRPSILNVHLRADDPSPAMRRLAQHLKAQVSG